LRDTKLDLPTRLDAAKAAAPYTNPRLASIGATFKSEVKVVLTEEQRVERARQAILEAFAERPALNAERKIVAGRESMGGRRTGEWRGVGEREG
jgi:hypothetical protein